MPINSSQVTDILASAEHSAMLVWRKLREAQTAATATEHLTLCLVVDAAAHVHKSIQMLQAARNADARNADARSADA